jgi:hypothetical protein
MRINFGEWLPDQPGVAGALVDAKNVIPQQVGYGPLSSPSEWSNAASETLNSVAAAAAPDEAVTVFAGGDTKLFKLGTNLNLSDVSKSGGYTTPSDQKWRFTQFGNRVIAANGGDRLQGYLMGSSTLFADLGAAAPKSRYVTTVRDFVVAGFNNGSTVYPNRVEWCALGDETSWTPAATTQADYQDIPDGGHVKGLTGGEYGIVFMDRAVVRMSYVGSPLVFQFDTISRGLGCMEPNSVIQYAGSSFFLSDDGFYVTNGQEVKSISVEKVDRWFFNTVDISQLSTMSAAVDPLKNLVIWCFKTVDQTTALLIYNFNLSKWSYAEINADTIASSTAITTTSSSGLTLEQLDAFGGLDSLPASLDSFGYTVTSTLLTGTLGAKIIAFSGSNLTANIVTPDLSLNDMPSVMTLIRPVIDSGTCSVQVNSRRRLNQQTDFTGSTYTSNDDNRIGLRSAGTYHRIKAIPSGSWSSAVGLDVTIVPQGMR